MSKKLNIIEAMKMPIGTEFKVIFNGEEIIRNTMMIYQTVKNQEYKHLDWSCHPKDVDMKPYDFLINGVFIPIQQPVSFMEAINSGKRIKCVHDRFTSTNIYMTISEMFYRMSVSTKSDFIPTLVSEGKWYIEESEDDSNE